MTSNFDGSDVTVITGHDGTVPGNNIIINY